MKLWDYQSLDLPVVPIANFVGILINLFGIITIEKTIAPIMLILGSALAQVLSLLTKQNSIYLVSLLIGSFTREYFSPVPTLDL